jgi:hypothetical protein
MNDDDAHTPAQIYVTRDGQRLGPYSLQEINERLGNAAISPSDLAWYQGINDWVPLSSVPGIATTPPPYPPDTGPLVPGMPPSPAPGSPPIAVTPAPVRSPSRSEYRDYKEVPWFRRSSTNSFFILANVLSFGWIPGILAVCIIALTGNVYLKSRDENGNLKKWGRGNRIAAFVLLLFYLFLFGRGFVSGYTQ